MNYISKSLVFIISFSLLIACSTVQPDRDFEKTDVIGHIIDVDEANTAVKVSADNVYAAPTITFIITDVSTFFNEEKDEISFKDLEVGQNINAWYTDPVQGGYSRGIELNYLQVVDIIDDFVR
ncbi:hypothetical protein QA612_13095 [Evansella sp. AB-P1]|uniref:hypothetical protein n=1 Tax=Evansella sp. AB-P1 TaxID=3037653 RepID=UPI00241D9314|nr:hypothetical protein [Evansella sp. AB-P1]MDG5788419.1 hypothetical protein [Evansella sp. AB-P1]